MEYKLSNSQIKLLSCILEQKQNAKKLYDEILEAEQELYAMIIKYANLPANAYQLKQVGDDIVLFSEETLAHESKGEGKEE